MREAVPEDGALESGHQVPPLPVPDLSRWVGGALDLDRRHRTVQTGDRLVWQGMTLAVAEATSVLMVWAIAGLPTPAARRS